MYSLALFSALVAIGSSVVSAQSASTCTSEIKIAEPTFSVKCDVVDANIIVDENLAGSLSIEGPKQLKKDLIITNATKLISISSSTINSIGGRFHVEGLQLLSSINLASLMAVNIVELINLPQLNVYTLGNSDNSGVAEANSITIIDTFISRLDLNIVTANVVEISNNFKLTKFAAPLVNVTKYLKIANNGNNMHVQLKDLMNAGEVEFRDVKTVEVPVLSRVRSIKVNDSPGMTSFSANNMTDVDESLTFINNKKLEDLSFNSLRSIKGDMTTQNNTSHKKIKFPRLETVGNLLLRGVFEEVDLPSLKDVKGSATVTSTTDISSFCKYFDDLKAKGDIRGKESCTSNNKNANEGGNGGQTNQDNKDAAGMVSVNMAMLGLALLAGIAQLL